MVQAAWTPVEIGPVPRRDRSGSASRSVVLRTEIGEWGENKDVGGRGPTLMESIVQARRASRSARMRAISSSDSGP